MVDENGLQSDRNKLKPRKTLENQVKLGKPGCNESNLEKKGRTR